MKIKKWIALLAALCMAIGTMALVACGSGGGGNDNSSESSVANSDSSEIDWPLGSVGNPYWCYYELDPDTGDIVGDSMYVPTIKANTSEYYLICKSGDKTICIEQADLTIVYKDTTYSAKDGAIEIKAQPAIAGDLNDWAVFQIINETENDIEIVMTFKVVELEEGEGDVSDVSSDVSSEVNSEEVGE